MTQPKKRVGLWIRVSTEDQAKGESPLVHEERGKGYALSRGWEIAATYHLEGVSGKMVMDHPETKRMMYDIATGKISGLMFSKLARLARNTKELLEFSDFFREHDADLISLHESIDTSTAAGRLFYTVIAAMSQWEREEIADRVAASVPIRAKLGKSTGGQAPFGYAWVKDQLQLDPTEAPIRKLMFELYLEHKRKNTVARILNERGYRSRKGSKFSERTIDRYLRDPIAKGLRRANYTKSTGQGKHWVLKPEDEWVFVPAPAIVSEEVWEEANQILKQFQTTRTKKSRGVKHLFSGKIKCHCGPKMYVPTNMKKYVCMTCRNKIPTEDIEEIFHEQLQAYFLSDDIISKQLSKHQETLRAKEVELQTLHRETSEIRGKINNILDLVHTGQLPKEGFKSHYDPLHQQLQQLEIRVPNLEGEIEAMKLQLQSRDMVLKEAKGFYEQWPQFNFERKRAIVETIVESIIISDGEDLTFNLNYLPGAQPSNQGKKIDPDLFTLNSGISPYSFKLMTKGLHIPRGWRCLPIEMNRENLLCFLLWIQ